MTSSVSNKKLGKQVPFDMRTAMRLVHFTATFFYNAKSGQVFPCKPVVIFVNNIFVINEFDSLQ